MSARQALASALAVALTSLAAAPAGARAQGGSSCQNDIVCRLLEQNIGIKEPLTLAQLRAFAPLVSDRATAVRNAHVPGQTDSIHELTYAGLAVIAYVPARGFVLLQRVTVTSARYTLPLKLRFGASTFDDVQQAVGLASDIEHLPDGGSRWRYDNVERTASVTFEFEPEPSMKIRRVEWRFGID